MSLSIRAMREDDVDRVMAIAGGLNGAPAWPRSVYVAALHEEKPWQRLSVVAEVDAEIWGFGMVSLVLDQAELETIAVAGVKQGRGLGKAILESLIEGAGMAGATDLMLEVRASNDRAIALYRRAGFAETGRRASYYASPVEDALLMSRKLP